MDAFREVPCVKTFLKLLFAAILVSMLAVTTWASLDRSVVAAAVDLWRDPWGRATLFDTYFAFLTFFAWVCYKQTRVASRLGWFVGILLLGNIAMAVYVLRELFRLRDGETFATLLTRRNT